MSKYRTHPDAYKSCETDWPVSLYAQIVMRPSRGVEGYVGVADTRPAVNKTMRVRATFTSDSRNRDLLVMIGYLETMITQLKRQYELLDPKDH